MVYTKSTKFSNFFFANYFTRKGHQLAHTIYFCIKNKIFRFEKVIKLYICKINGLHISLNCLGKIIYYKIFYYLQKLIGIVVQIRTTINFVSLNYF